MDLSSYALYPHQVSGVEFLARRGRAILGDDMGLGKTRQAIIAMKEAALLSRPTITTRPHHFLLHQPVLWSNGRGNYRRR